MSDSVEVKDIPSSVIWFGKNIKTYDLFENMNESEVLEFMKNKLETWNYLIDSNSLLSEEEKSKIKENFQLFEEYVKNNKALFNKYQLNQQLFFRKILEKLNDKNLLNKKNKYSFENIGDVEMKFEGWDIILEISDNDMDQFFWENFGWLTTPTIIIDWVSIYPIVVRKSEEKKDQLISHELQHFYNKFLIKSSDKLKDIVINSLADETIAQTIFPTFWITAQEWKSYLAQCLSSGSMNWDSHMSYAFWNRFNLNEVEKMGLNMDVLVCLDKIDIAREMKEAWIPNYADILAITPLDKWDELRDFYLNK